MKSAVKIVVTLIAILLVGYAIARAQGTESPQAQAVNADKPKLPPTATVQPLAVDQNDVQAVMGPLQQAQAYLSAIAVLQKEVDALQAQAQRSFSAAQAKHPDMPIDMKTWTYTAVKK